MFHHCFCFVQYPSVLSFPTRSWVKACGAMRYPCPTEALRRSWPKCWKAVNFRKGAGLWCEKKAHWFCIHSWMEFGSESDFAIYCRQLNTLDHSYTSYAWLYHNSMHWRWTSVAQVESFPRPRMALASKGLIQWVITDREHARDAQKRYMFNGLLISFDVLWVYNAVCMYFILEYVEYMEWICFA